MTHGAKVVVVLGGYGAAFVAASVATALRIALTANNPDAIASSGMYAGGDMLTFLAVFGLVALVPTGAVLVFARSWARFGGVLASAAGAVALSGVLGLLAFVQPFGRTEAGGLLAVVSVLAVLRLLAAPLVAAGLAFAALVAPSRGARRAVMVAFVVEGLICLWDVFHFVIAPHW